MSDFIFNEDGTLTHLNGRVANGIRINDVRTLEEIQSATSFEPSDVASASALKSSLEWVDISNDFKRYITPSANNTGSISDVNAMRNGNLVTLTLIVQNPSVLPTVSNIYSGNVSKYKPKSAVVYGIGMRGNENLFVTAFDKNGDLWVRNFIGNSPANIDLRVYVTYYTEDFS